MGRPTRGHGRLVRRARFEAALREWLPRRIWALRLALVALLIGACGDDPTPGLTPHTAAVSAALTVTSPELLTIDFPASVEIETVPILAKGTLRLNDRVTVVGATTARR